MEGLGLDKEPAPAALGRAKQAPVELGATRRAGTDWEVARGEPDALSTPNGSWDSHKAEQRNGRKPFGHRCQIMSTTLRGMWSRGAARSTCRCTQSHMGTGIH